MVVQALPAPIEVTDKVLENRVGPAGVETFSDGKIMLPFSAFVLTCASLASVDRGMLKPEILKSVDGPGCVGAFVILLIVVATVLLTDSPSPTPGLVVPEI